MRIGIRLSEPLLATLRAVLAGESVSYIPIPTVAALDELLDRRALDLYILEPTLVSPDELPPLSIAGALHPEVAGLIYTTISPAAMRMTVELARAGFRHVVLKGFDDGTRRFRAIIAELVRGRWDSRLFAMVVKPRVERAPAPLGRAVARLFQAPHEMQSADDLARVAGMHRRSVERALGRVGIASARLLVASARIERAHAWLTREGRTVTEVAERLAYPSPRAFAREVKWATGRAPGILRYAVTADELVAGLAARLTAEVGAASGGRGGAPPPRAD